MINSPLEIIDISQPVSEKTACFPGDVPFSKEVTLTYKDSKVVNLTAITMSPHIGTHADAPAHIFGDMQDAADLAGGLPLHPFVGKALVLDISPMTSGPVTKEHVIDAAAEFESEWKKDIPLRVLLKTQQMIAHESFLLRYPYIGADAVEYLSSKGAILVGIDTPSVDDVRSKTLETHHTLLKHKMFWLENLDLTGAQAGFYTLIALPLKLMEVEATPVRAILLKQ